MVGKRKVQAQGQDNPLAPAEHFFNLLGGSDGQVWANRILHGEAEQVIRDLA